MSIAIAMATYNGAPYLRQQLASLATQTQLPAELVVSDDDSTDATLDIIRHFAKTAPFEVRILEKDRRLGFADNFLHAAGNCRAELIAFCDQDDVWLPAKLETACRRIETDGSLLAMHTLTKTDTDLNPVGLWTQGIAGDVVCSQLELLPYKNGWGNSMLFRRELLELVRPEQRPRQPEQPERPLSHDSWIYVLADGLGRVSHIADPLLLYRLHDTQTMGFERSGRAGRIARKLVLSVVNQRERYRFYRRMAELFGTIARGDSSFAGPAVAASVLYSSLAAPLKARLCVYDDPSLAERFRAFCCLSNLGATARLKHLVLGVSGVHKLAEELVNARPGAIIAPDGGPSPSIRRKSPSILADEGVIRRP
jgi:glycosyltransferase involved in cell wall biosynthesis